MIKKYLSNKANLIFVIIIAVLFLLRIPSLFEPVWYGDEGIYAALAQDMFHGEKLYVDTWDHKPPAIYLLYTFAKVFGTGNLFVVKLVSIIAAIGTVIFLRKIATKFFSEKIALVVSGIFAFLLGTIILEGNIANAENYFMFFTTLGVYLYLNSEEKKAKILAGVSFAVAVLFKLHPLFDFIALLFFIFVSALRNKSKLKKIIMDFLYVGVPFVLVQLLSFAITGFLIGSFQEYIFTNFIYNFGYTSYTETAVKASFFSLQSQAFRVTVTTLLFLISGGLFYFKKISDKLFLLIIWFVAGLFAAFLSARPYPHYLLQIVPPFVLLLGFLLWKFSATKKLYVKIIAVLIPLLLLFGGFKTFFPGVEGFKDISKAVIAYNYYTNFFGLVSGNLTQEKYNESFDKKVNGTLELAEYIDEKGNNKLDESGRIRVYLWGNSPWFYDHANVNNVSRYVVDFHIGGDEVRRTELVNDIQNDQPAFIIQESGTELFDGLKTEVEENYDLVGVNVGDRFLVYERK